MIKPTIERPSSVASVSSLCRSCSRPLLAVLLISLVVTNAEEGVRNLTNVWPTANGRPLITTAVVSSTPSNLRIAYCLALVGAPTVAMAAQHLAAISLLRQTGTKKDVLSMQSPNSILRLGDALRTLDTKVVFVPHVEGKCRTSSSAEQSRFRFSFSFHILRVYEQTQYDKILYLDGDLAVRTPPDRLVEAWARQGTTELRTPTGCNRVPDQKHYNTGVWGITPSRDYAARLYPWLAAGKFPCGIGSQTWVEFFGANNSWTRASLAWNLKADQGTSRCMRKWGLREAHVVHWSGNRKPLGLRTADPVEARALAAYQAAHLRWLTFLDAPAVDNIRIWHNRTHTQRSGATNQSALSMPLPRCNASAPDVAPKASMRQRLCAKPEVRAALSAASVPVLWSRDLVRSQKRFMNEKPFAASKFEPFIEQLPRNSLMSSAWPDGCEMCDTCAVVGAGGSLRKFEHGAQIDGHSLVLRPNWIITKGYENKVGTRTSINLFFGVEGMMEQFEKHQRSLPEERRAIGLITSNSDRSVASFFRYMHRVRKSTVLNKTATAAETLVTPSRVFLTTDAVYHKALAEVCRATGEGCMWQRTSGTMRPSTGFISVIIALQICRNVSLFGLTDDPCQPFHYYGEPKATCTKAIPTKNDEPLHWFEKEHEIYARWHREGRLTVYS